MLPDFILGAFQVGSNKTRLNSGDGFALERLAGWMFIRTALTKRRSIVNYRRVVLDEMWWPHRGYHSGQL